MDWRYNFKMPLKQKMDWSNRLSLSQCLSWSTTKNIIPNQENFDNTYPYNWCQRIFPLFLHPQWHLAKILKYVQFTVAIQEKSLFLQKVILSNNYMLFRYERQIQIPNYFYVNFLPHTLPMKEGLQVKMWDARRGSMPESCFPTIK